MIGNEFFELAKELRSHESMAAKRTAVSRCYYGLMNAARSRILPWVSKGHFSNTKQEHADLPRDLERYGGDAGAQVAACLKELFNARRAADYENKYPGDSRFEQLVDIAFLRAEEGFAALARVDEESFRESYNRITHPLGQKR